MTLVALSGWLLALAAAWRAVALRRRLELVARAEHELRGPLAALTLAVEAARRHSRALAAVTVEGQLERARAGLADLAAARTGRRAAARPERVELGAAVERAVSAWSAAGAGIAVDWQAGESPVDADAGRLSQALGNLLANGIEHGGGSLALRAVRSEDRVRVELRDRGRGFARTRGRAGRGRGLSIAADAVREAGGAMRVASGDDGATVAIELPLAEP